MLSGYRSSEELRRLWACRADDARMELVAGGDLGISVSAEA